MIFSPLVRYAAFLHDMKGGVSQVRLLSLLHQPESLLVHQPESRLVHQPESLLVHQPESRLVHQPESHLQHWTQQQWQTCNQQMSASYGMPSMAANATVNLLGAKKEAAKVRWI